MLNGILYFQIGKSVLYSFKIQVSNHAFNSNHETFFFQALNVEASGGIGLVLIDQTEGSTYETRIISTLAGSGVDTEIPVVLIFNREGNELLSVIESNSDIYLYLGNERVEQGRHIYEWTMPINNLEKTGITSQHICIRISKCRPFPMNSLSLEKTRHHLTTLYTHF